jgi:hypothetical protein
MKYRLETLLLAYLIRIYHEVRTIQDYVNTPHVNHTNKSSASVNAIRESIVLAIELRIK